MTLDLLNYWQKKTYLHYLKTKKSFLKLPLGKRLSFVAYLFIFLSYPGQNHWQTLQYHPLSSKYKVETVTTSSSHLVPFSDSTPVPSLTAQAVYVFEPNSGTVLYEKNSDLLLYPASTTKIMTALVALETYNLEDTLPINNQGIVGNSLDFFPGQQFSAKDLLSSVLVASANDGALALADNYPQGGYLGFIDQMNQKAKSFHLNHTTYSNVSGIESQDHKTTVQDLAVLTKEAIKNPLFLEFVGTSSLTIKDSAEQNSYHLENTNLLLNKIDGLRGVKTGWTELAGECLVTYVDRDGLKVITVVLNSQDRFTDSAKIIEWVYSHHTWQEI